MKALITGIGGFVGPYLKKELEAFGYEVFGFERTVHQDTKNVYFGDLLQKDSIENALLKMEPGVVFHLAGFSSVQKSFEQPDLCYEINVTGTQNLLDACLKLKSRPRVVIVSSAEVYGRPQVVPIAEDHPLVPTSPYGVSRLDQEKLVWRYSAEMEIVVLRSFNHTGPGQPPIFAIPSFAKQIVEAEKGLGSPEMFVGNLDAVRDFTDVRDVVRAYRLAGAGTEASQAYNVCSGIGFSMKELLYKLIELSGVKIDVKQDPERLRPSDVPVLIGSNSKFKKATGWVVALSFEQTLRDMLDFWRSNLKL